MIFAKHVPSSQPTDDPSACDGGMAYGDDIRQFSLENTGRTPHLPNQPSVLARPFPSSIATNL